MSLKRCLRLDVILLVLTATVLVSSVVRYFEHEPRWSLLAAAGFGAVLLFARPKACVLMLFLTTAYFFAGWLGVNLPFFEEITRFSDTLLFELNSWQNIYYFPGPVITLSFGLLAVFSLVLFQLALASRGFRGSLLVLTGFLVYLGLWLQHYPRAEQDLIVFLALALTVHTLLSLAGRESPQKSPEGFFQAGILALGILSALFVVFAPYQAPLYYGEEASVFVQKQLPGLYKLQRTVEGCLPLNSRWIGTPQTASLSGYAPGGALGGSVVESEKPVMELELKEGTLPRSLYLRGHASDYYTGRAWETTDFPPAKDLQHAFRSTEVYTNGVELILSYLHPEKDLFGLFPTTAIRFLEEEHAPQKIHLDIAGNLKASGEPFQGSYRLSGKTIAPLNLHHEKPRPELELEPLQRLNFLQLPEGLPERVKILSGEIVGGAATELQKAEKIKEYLQQFPYNRTAPALPPDREFLDFFLFEVQEGYCAYFATAMTVLLRTQGISARYVEGYRVPTAPHPEEEGEAPGSGNIQVKQKHAHAWVEAFLAGYGWVVFEPTPPYTFSSGAGTGEPEGAEGESAGPAEDTETEHGVAQDAEADEESAEETTGEEEEKEAGLDQPEEPSAENPEDSPKDEPGTEAGEKESGQETESTPGQDDEGKPEAGLPPVLLAFSLPALFLFSAWIAVCKDLAGSREPAAVYRKIIQLKSAFHRPPAPEETPEQIVAQLREQLPDLAEELECLKDFYHLSCYAAEGANSRPLLPQELRILPLKLVRLYRKKTGTLKFIRCLGGVYILKISGHLYASTRRVLGRMFSPLSRYF